MNCEEMSNTFDTLVSSYRRFKDFDNRELLDSVEFDEYEKSLYLTKSQEELVISLYSGRTGNGDSFEGTEELRRYLSPLVEEAEVKPITNTSGLPLGMGSQSKFFTLPEDVWYITYEAVEAEDPRCSAYNPLEVYPVSQDDYHKTKRNPFRGPNDRRALRLDLSDGIVEIVSKYNLSTYYLRYLRKPVPIVLVDLPNDLTIEGVGTQEPCELHEALHSRIVELAVREAMQSKAVSSDNKEKS